MICSVDFIGSVGTVLFSVFFSVRTIEFEFDVEFELDIDFDVATEFDVEVDVEVEIDVGRRVTFDVLVGLKL